MASPKVVFISMFYNIYQEKQQFGYTRIEPNENYISTSKTGNGTLIIKCLECDIKNTFQFWCLSQDWIYCVKQILSAKILMSSWSMFFMNLD